MTYSLKEVRAIRFFENKCGFGVWAIRFFENKYCFPQNVDLIIDAPCLFPIWKNVILPMGNTEAGQEYQ